MVFRTLTPGMCDKNQFANLSLDISSASACGKRSVGSHRSPECMCIVSIVWLRSRDDYSDPWEGPEPSFGPSARVEDVCKDECLEMIGPCVQKVVIAASSSWMFIA